MLFFSSETSGTRADDVKQWFVDVFGGGSRTTAGIRMSPQKTLAIPAVFRAVDNLAGHIAMLPFPTIERGKDDKGRELRHRLFDDPLDELLNLRASHQSRAFDFKRSLIAHRLVYGNGFAEITVNGSGQPIAMYNLMPWQTQLKWDEDDVPYYEHRDDMGRPTQLALSEVLHIAGLGDDGLMGHIVHHLGRENFGLIAAIERFAQTFFGNGGLPRIVFEYDGNFGKNEEKKKAFAASFDKNLSRGNANRSAVLENGMKAKVVSQPNDESQMLESRQFSVKDVCRWLNVPPHLLYELSDATYNNIDQMSRGYVIYSMGPIIAEVEQEFNYKLIRKGDRKKKFVEIKVEGLLRGDTKSRYEAHKSAIEAGWRNRNEVRQLENENPVDGLDEFLQPLNHTAAGQQNANVVPKTDNAKAIAAMVETFANSVDAVLAGWKDVIAKAAARKAEKFDAEDFAAKITAQAWPILSAFEHSIRAAGQAISDDWTATAAKAFGREFVAATLAGAETLNLIRGQLWAAAQSGDGHDSN